GRARKCRRRGERSFWAKTLVYQSNHEFTDRGCPTAESLRSKTARSKTPVNRSARSEFAEPTGKMFRHHLVSAPQLRSLNLSGFASLRDISAIKRQAKFFTLRREGAKKTHDSKCSRHEPVCASSLILEEAFAQRDHNSCRLRGLPDGRCPGAGTQSCKQQHHYLGSRS